MGGYAPGPWDQQSDPSSVDDGTMCRIPSNPPGITFTAAPPVANASIYVPPPPSAAPPTLTLIVIGSPSSDQKYQYQFVTAAECRPKDENTIWLIEKTGYEIYGVSLDYITKAAPKGGYGWITPKTPLLGWINAFKPGVIKNLVIFSHGLRGLVALRYGWDQELNPDYGLTVDEAAKVDASRFAPGPKIEFDSCNSGVPESSGGLSVAQALANRLKVSVGAWTGRTSYADINHGSSCAVQGSSQSLNPLRSEMYKEGWSRFKSGESPQYKMFEPAKQ